MGNKGFLILLSAILVVALTFVSAATDLLPSFLAPFILILFGLYLIYMTR